MPHDRLLTTTIGAYPKPGCTPIGDWFPDPHDTGAGAEGEGLLTRWQRADYEQRLAQAGEAAEAAFVEAIEEVVRDQVDAGIDVPTDGQVRRENYIFYQCRNLNGIDFEHLTEKVARDGAFTARVPTITGPVTPRDLVLARDWRIAQRVTDRSVKITLPGPMTVTDSLANAFYPDPKTQGLALAEALNAEVRSLAAAGCRHIQVDEPVFARKPQQALDYGIENLERVFHGVPEDVQRIVHMCCGYPGALDTPDYPKADPQAYFQIAGRHGRGCDRCVLDRGCASTERPEPARTIRPDDGPVRRGEHRLGRRSSGEIATDTPAHTKSRSEGVACSRSKSGTRCAGVTGARTTRATDGVAPASATSRTPRT